MESNSCSAPSSCFKASDCTPTIIPPNASNLVHSLNHDNALCPLHTSTPLTCPNWVADESHSYSPTPHKPQPSSNARVIPMNRLLRRILRRDAAHHRGHWQPPQKTGNHIYRRIWCLELHYLWLLVLATLITNCMAGNTPTNGTTLNENINCNCQQ
jgi:hypothetical protein